MSPFLISILIFFGVTIAVILCLVALFFYIKKRLSRFSRQVLGTSNLTQVASHISDAQKEYTSTPKSISDTTNIYLPKIMADFPDFHYDEMTERAKNVLTAYLMSMKDKVSKLPDYVTSELSDELNLHLDHLKQNNQYETYKNIKIHKCAMNRYSKTDGRCIISLQISVQYIYTLKDALGKLLKGNPSTIYQAKYNVDLMYIQDRSFIENMKNDTHSITCPNCGAPATSLGAKTCPYCGTAIQEINIHSWSFNNIVELTK